MAWGPKPEFQMLPKAAIIVPKPRFCHCSKTLLYLINGPISCIWVINCWQLYLTERPQHLDWLCPCCEINCDTSSNALEAPSDLQWHSPPCLLVFANKAFCMEPVELFLFITVTDGGHLLVEVLITCGVHQKVKLKDEQD